MSTENFWKQRARLLEKQLITLRKKFQEVQKLTMQKQKESNERAKANLSLSVIIF